MIQRKRLAIWLINLIICQLDILLNINSSLDLIHVRSGDVPAVIDTLNKTHIWISTVLPYGTL